MGYVIVPWRVFPWWSKLQGHPNMILPQKLLVNIQFSKKHRAVWGGPPAAFMIPIDGSEILRHWKYTQNSSWWFQPRVEYARQVGSSLQVWRENSNIWNHHLVTRSFNLRVWYIGLVVRRISEPSIGITFSLHKHAGGEIIPNIIGMI